MVVRSPSTASDPMRISVDIGGTFTDLVLEDRGRLELAKAPTVPHDPAEGILDVLTAAAEARGTSCAELLAATDTFVHATTRGLNAVTFAIMTIFSSGISMYALGLLFELVLGWSFTNSVLLSAAIVLIYTLLGGLVSETDWVPVAMSRPDDGSQGYLFGIEAPPIRDCPAGYPPPPTP